MTFRLSQPCLLRLLRVDVSSACVRLSSFTTFQLRLVFVWWTMMPLYLRLHTASLRAAWCLQASRLYIAPHRVDDACYASKCRSSYYCFVIRALFQPLLCTLCRVDDAVPEVVVLTETVFPFPELKVHGTHFGIITLRPGFIHMDWYLDLMQTINFKLSFLLFCNYCFATLIFLNHFLQVFWFCIVQMSLFLYLAVPSPSVTIFIFLFKFKSKLLDSEIIIILILQFILLLTPGFGRRVYSFKSKCAILFTSDSSQ